MSKDIRSGTVEQLWANVEVGGKGIWTYAHFELNGVPARLRLDSASSQYDTPAPTPFAEGERIVVSGQMGKDTFDVQTAYLPERDEMIAPPVTLVAILGGVVFILAGIPFLHGAIKFHAEFAIWLMGLAPIAGGLYFLTLPFDQRTTEKRMKAMAEPPA